jgi:hypothetical protein
VKGKLEVNAVTVLREQLTQGHAMMEQAVADLSRDELHRRMYGATIQSIAAIYAHTVTGEDMLVNGTLRGRTPLFESGGWSERLGFGPGDGMLSDAWAATVRIDDLAALREYARQVYASSDDYLGSLADAELDRTFDTGWMGETTVGSFLATIIVWHVVQHGGEICALKGCMGGTGLPW